MLRVPVPLPGDVRNKTELPDAGLIENVPLPPRFIVELAPAGRATVIVVVLPGASSDKLFVPEMTEPPDSISEGVLRTR